MSTLWDNQGWLQEPLGTSPFMSSTCLKVHFISKIDFSALLTWTDVKDYKSRIFDCQETFECLEDLLERYKNTFFFLCWQEFYKCDHKSRKLYSFLADVLKLEQKKFIVFPKLWKKELARYWLLLLIIFYSIFHKLATLVADFHVTRKNIEN